MRIRHIIRGKVTGAHKEENKLTSVQDPSAPAGLEAHALRVAEGREAVVGQELRPGSPFSYPGNDKNTHLTNRTINVNFN